MGSILITLMTSIISGVLVFEYQRWRGKPRRSPDAPSDTAGPIAGSGLEAPETAVEKRPLGEDDYQFFGGVAGFVAGVVGGLVYPALMGGAYDGSGNFWLVLGICVVVFAAIGTAVGSFAASIYYEFVKN